MHIATILSPDKSVAGQVGVKNSKIDGSSNFKTKIFSHFEKKALSLFSLMERDH